MNLPVSRDKVVSVSYVLRNARGEVYEIRDLPVEYLHGSGADLFPRIEEALDGKSVGDLVSISLTPDEAFGERDPGLSFTDDLDHVPEELRRIGAQFEAKNSRGESRTFVVTHIADGKLTVDANHPLAGQTVTFDVTVRDVREATPQEVRAGRPGSDGRSLLQ